MTKTALIIGIDSHIGKALAAHLRSCGWGIFGTSRRTPQHDPNIFYVDLEHEHTIKNIHGAFDVIYACAAITNMAFCENNPEISKQINFSAQIAVAKHCINKTANYVFMSTAGVFDGSKSGYATSDHITPKCIYGAHKAMCEQFLLNLSDKVTIVRTTKVISRDNNLVLEWLKNLHANLPIQPFNDMTLSAVTMDSIVDLLKRIGESRRLRIVHISGRHDVLYSDFAAMLAAHLHKPAELVQPRTYASVGITATTVFPYSSLDMTETTKEYGIQPCEMADILGQIFEIKTTNFNIAHALFL